MVTNLNLRKTKINHQNRTQINQLELVMINKKHLFLPNP